MNLRTWLGKRAACWDEDDWARVLSLRFVDRGYFNPRDGRQGPSVDCSELAYSVRLDNLRWRCEVLCVALLKPYADGKSPGQSSATVEQGKMLADFSNIWEFLTSTSWSDGTSRRPGSLSLKLTSDTLQVTLTDPSTAVYCCRSGQTLEEALTSLEMAFLDNTQGWRKSGFAKPKK